MVTITKIGEEYNSQILEISGLSTDPKPVGQIDGASIANGSIFKEIDTGKEYTYNESAETWHVNKTASSSGGSGVDGEDGGYYTPGVTQPTTNTMQISFTPSKLDMPNVNPVTVNLPVSDNSGENVTGGGLTTAQINALHGIFKVCVFDDSQDVDGAIAAFEEAFGLASGDDSGGGAETPEVTTYTIAYELVNVTSNSSVSSVAEGASYSATLTAADGYTMEGATVTVTMGGTDITAETYADGVISIASVTGNVEIMASAVQVEEVEAVLPEDGLLAYVDLRNMTDEEVAGVKVGSANGILPTQGEGAYYSWASQLIASSNEYGAQTNRSLVYAGDPGSASAYTPDGDFTSATLIYTPETKNLPLASYPARATSSNLASHWGYVNIRYKNSDGADTMLETLTLNAEDYAATGYLSVTVVVSGTVLRYYINGVLAIERDGADVDGFGTWVMHPSNGNGGCIEHGKTASSGYVVAGAAYSKALSEVEVTELTAFFKTLEVTE